MIKNDKKFIDRQLEFYRLSTHFKNQDANAVNFLINLGNNGIIKLLEKYGIEETEASIKEKFSKYSKDQVLTYDNYFIIYRKNVKIMEHLRKAGESVRDMIFDVLYALAYEDNKVQYIVNMILYHAKENITDEAARLNLETQELNQNKIALLKNSELIY